ncbi:MAG: HlyC/CorC family transporter [Bacteroidales bacterium]|nr:HlyC/CorC family transporter [Bacteroidales bacterium]
MELLIIYLLVALLFSFTCSVLEAVILSVTPSYINVKLENKKNYAPRLQKLKENIDRPLAAILTLNTFAHTIGAAGVGAQAQKIWGNEYLSVVSAILTLLILVFSEIIPKTIGANYWRSLTPATVTILRILMIILYPFVWLSQQITKLFNIKNRKNILSRADLSTMADIAVKEGVMRHGESRIIKNVARFNQLQVKDIMTPRTVVFGAPDSISIKTFYESFKNIKFSRIPIYKNNIDNITGYILKDDLLMKKIEGQNNLRLSSFKRPIQTIYVSLPIPELYNLLIEKKEHIALVVDEYGGTAGVVTLEDVIETILGMEIIDETDNITDLRKAARENWTNRARRMGIQV